MNKPIKGTEPKQAGKGKMSLSLIGLRWVAAQDTSMKEYAMLCALIRYANRKGECYPKQKTLGEEIGCSVRTVREAEKGLIEKGLISVETRRAKAGYDKNFYRVNWDKPPAKSAAIKEEDHRQNLPQATGKICPQPPAESADSKGAIGKGANGKNKHTNEQTASIEAPPGKPPQGETPELKIPAEALEALAHTLKQKEMNFLDAMNPKAPVPIPDSDAVYLLKNAGAYLDTTAERIQVPSLNQKLGAQCRPFMDMVSENWPKIRAVLIKHDVKVKPALLPGQLLTYLPELVYLLEYRQTLDAEEQAKAQQKPEVPSDDDEYGPLTEEDFAKLWQ